MTSNVTDQPQWIVPDPSWIPIGRGPFQYRYDPGFDGSVRAEGSSDEYLKMVLRGLGVVAVDIDVGLGEFALIFEPYVAGPFGFPLRFHPAEFPAEEMRQEDVRAETAKNVAIAWSIMCDEFRAAVLNGNCMVIGRTEKYSNPLTIVAPDVFAQFEEIDWIKGKAKAESGESYYSLHIAPLDRASEMSSSERPQECSRPEAKVSCEAFDKPKQRSAPASVKSSIPLQADPSSEEQSLLMEDLICTYLEENYPNKKPRRVSYDAIAALFTEHKGYKVSESWVRQTAQNRLGWPRRRKKA